MRTLIFCADDYGISSGVSEGIRRLLKAGRLSATSCMTVTPYWEQECASLKEFKGKADIGLHFTLTETDSLGYMPLLAPENKFPSFGRLYWWAIRKKLPLDEIEEQLNRQLDRFEENFGAPPDFLDGHHHVHQLPGIREVLLRTVLERYPKHKLWIRVCWENPLWIMRRGMYIGRSLAIGWHGRALQERARMMGIPSNSSFAGIYDFAVEAPFKRLIEQTLKTARHKTLVICHPGLVDVNGIGSDSLTATREKEFLFLKGDSFQSLLEKHKLRLGRFFDYR
jgi:chitin disaccharide deacetylase